MTENEAVSLHTKVEVHNQMDSLLRVIHSDCLWGRNVHWWYGALTSQIGCWAKAPTWFATSGSIQLWELVILFSLSRNLGPTAVVPSATWHVSLYPWDRDLGASTRPKQWWNEAPVREILCSFPGPSVLSICQSRAWSTLRLQKKVGLVTLSIINSHVKPYFQPF